MEKEDDRRSLDERLDRLENAILRLTGSVDRLEKSLSTQDKPQIVTAPASPVKAAPASAPYDSSKRREKPVPPAKSPRTPGTGTPRKEIKIPAIIRTPKFWFNVIGVVLLLLGVVFLYKYSVDQGWITSPMKVAFGMMLGAILLILGLILHGRQRFFSQMLAGAGIATFYLTGYAAFQLYELIPYSTAIAWMGAVTLAAFFVAVYEDDQVLAIVATIGGLAAIFLIHKGVSSRTDVVLFAIAVLSGSSAVYFFKGWRPLLWISYAGGWSSLVFIYAMSIPGYSELSENDKLGLQAGVIFMSVAFWVLPLLREALSARNPLRWPQPHRITAREEYEGVAQVLNRHVHALSISTPFLALWFTREIWGLSNRDWGWVTLGAAALFALAFLSLRGKEELQALAYTQALVDLALFTMALGLILDGDARFVALTAEATALHLVSWKLKDGTLLVAAHAFMAILAIWLVERLVDDPVQGTAVLNAHALAELAFIVVAMAISFLIYDTVIRYTYQLGAYIALLAWFLRELSEITNGQAYVTVAWAVCAVALLTAGIIVNNINWRMVALITLFAVVAKLLLVDLSAVKAILRVLLFIGLGAMFLVLSYFFQSLWKPAPGHSDKAAA